MKRLNLVLIGLMLLSMVQLSAQEYYMTSPIGYGRSTTGGGNASTTTVTTYNELKDALTASGSRVILVKGSIQVDYLSVLITNKTLLGLPGSKLYTNDQTSGESGILYIKPGSNNVIFRNLTFVGPGAYDSDGRDCLTNEGTNVWIDHCEFQDGMDGNFDNKGKADNVTVSWCKFTYLKPPKSGGSGGSNDHRYSNLVGSSSSNAPSDGHYSITWQNCWWADGCVERMVRARNAQLHMLNCYWNSSVAKKCLGLEDGTKGTTCYVEGGVFETPSSTKNIDPGYGGSPDVTFKDCVGSNLNNNSSTVSKPSYSYSAMSSSQVKSAVTSSCGAGATLNVSTSGVISSPCGGTNPPPTTTYTLSTNVSGSGTVSGAGTYNDGATASVRATAANGWTFSNWSGNASGTSNPVSITMNSNKSVTAVFVEDGGTNPPPAGDITHNFTASGTSSSFFNITGNLSTSKGTVNYGGMTLTQCLKIESSTSITFNSAQAGILTLVFNSDFNGDFKVDGTNKSVSSGILTVNLSSGNHTLTKGGSTNLYYVSLANEGGTTPVTYSLTTTINGSGSVNPGSGTYEEGASVSMTATPASGWKFDSWSGGSTSNPATVVMNGNKNITANFSQIAATTYTLSTTINGQGSVNPSYGTYEAGTSVSMTATPSSGWKFDSWSGGSTSNPATVVMNGNKSITANFSQTSTGGVTATIQENTTGFCNVDGSVDNNNGGFTGSGFANTSNATGNGIDYKINASGGSVTLLIKYASSSDRPAKIIVNNNTIVSNLSMPSTGSWTTWSSVSTTISLANGVNDLRIEATSGSGLANVDYISVTGSGVSAADCNGTTPVTYALSTTINGQGSVNPSYGTYAEGSSVSITATPASGWQFDSWSGGSTFNPATVVMNGNKNITANFSQIVTNLTLTIQENATGFCSVDGTIDNNNAGFTGNGFANTANAAGNGVDWYVNFASSGTYTFEFRYASGSDRPANLLINGSTVASNISFPSTGSWTSWSTVTFNATVGAGTNVVRLVATGSSGLGNIDYISITGNNPQAVDCSALRSAETLSMSQTETLNLKVYPNPFTTSATIGFELASQQDVSFKIYDLTGKIVDEISRTSYNAGENTLIYNNPGLKSGLYILSIQYGTTLKTKRFAIK